MNIYVLKDTRERVTTDEIRLDGPRLSHDSFGWFRILLNFTLRLNMSLIKIVVLKVNFNFYRKNRFTEDSYLFDCEVVFSSSNLSYFRHLNGHCP